MAAPESAVLRLTQLDIRRASDGARVIRGVDLQVQPGEIVGVVGDSGAGKTVLLDAVLHMIPFDHEMTGTIEVDGRSVLEANERDLDQMRGRTMAIIPSGGRRFLSPTTRVGKQLVRLLRRHLGLSKADAEAEAQRWLARVKIPDPARRMRSFPHELSGGMAQRVLIAMALMRSPKLVLADEPTAGLDVTIQKQVLDLLVELMASQGSACLLVTRDLGIVANYCARVAVMEAGHIVEVAATRDFFAGPSSTAGSRMLEMVRSERLADAASGGVPEAAFLRHGAKGEPA